MTTMSQTAASNQNLDALVAQVTTLSAQCDAMLRGKR